MQYDEESLRRNPLFEVKRKAIVHERYELTSRVLGELIVGTQLHVVDARVTADAALRVSIVLVGDSYELGWIYARWGEKGKQIKVIDQVREDSGSDGSAADYSSHTAGVTRELPMPLPKRANYVSPYKFSQPTAPARSPPKQRPPGLLAPASTTRLAPLTSHMPQRGDLPGGDGAIGSSSAGSPSAGDALDVTDGTGDDDASQLGLKDLASIVHMKLPRVRDIFHALDKDGNEVVTKKEFIKGMSDALPDARPKDIAELYRQCDPNADGKVEYGELLNVLRRVRF